MSDSVADPVSFLPRDPGWVKDLEPDPIVYKIFFLKLLKVFDADAEPDP